MQYQIEFIYWNAKKQVCSSHSSRSLLQPLLWLAQGMPQNQPALSHHMMPPTTCLSPALQESRPAVSGCISSSYFFVYCLARFPLQHLAVDLLPKLAYTPHQPGINRGQLASPPTATRLSFISTQRCFKPNSSHRRLSRSFDPLAPKCLVWLAEGLGRSPTLQVRNDDTIFRPAQTSEHAAE
jgi:hypothetical protein